MDRTLLEKKHGEHIIRFQVSISGAHTLEAKSGAHRDAITVRHALEENPDYKLKGGGILNWFDANGLKADCYCIEDLISELMKSPEAAKTVMRCVNTKGKDESDFIKELRTEPDRLKSLDITFNEMLDRCGGIASNILHHINAALQPKGLSKLLKWTVHTLEIFCWGKDFCESFDIEPDGLEPDTWRFCVEHSNGEIQDAESANGIPDRPDELLFSLSVF